MCVVTGYYFLCQHDLTTTTTRCPQYPLCESWRSETKCFRRFCVRCTAGYESEEAVRADIEETAPMMEQTGHDVIDRLPADLCEDCEEAEAELCRNCRMAIAEDAAFTLGRAHAAAFRAALTGETAAEAEARDEAEEAAAILMEMSRSNPGPSGTVAGPPVTDASSSGPNSGLYPLPSSADARSSILGPRSFISEPSPDSERSDSGSSGSESGSPDFIPGSVYDDGSSDSIPRSSEYNADSEDSGPSSSGSLDHDSPKRGRPGSSASDPMLIEEE